MKTAAVVGAGPAGLMAAWQLASHGISVTLLDRRPAPGRKLLIAGSSGLNITYDDTTDFASHYRESATFIRPYIEKFTPQAWLKFINDLGLETFLGSSRRYFVRDMKAANLVQKWMERLGQLGVVFKGETSIESLSDFENIRRQFGVVIFALGGGSWQAPGEDRIFWPDMFRKLGYPFKDFESSNVGFELDPTLIAGLEGKSLKNISLTTERGARQGDLMVTNYGIEGTPIYAVGITGDATLDLKPQLTVEVIIKKGKDLNLSENIRTLLCQHPLKPLDRSAEQRANLIKALPIRLIRPRPLAEAISSRGGLALESLTPDLELINHPGIYCVGEMLDWDAPTGGFLIQACVSQGFVAGVAASLNLKKSDVAMQVV